MAGYMAAIDWANECGESEVAELLEETLKKEIAANEKMGTVGTMLDRKIV